MVSKSGTVRIYITARTAAQAPCQDGVTNAAVLTPVPAPDSMLVCTLHTHAEQAIHYPKKLRLQIPPATPFLPSSEKLLTFEFLAPVWR
jgi:hypothetical protein